MVTPSYNKEKVVNIVRACVEQNSLISSYSVLVSLVQFVFIPKEAQRVKRCVAIYYN